VSIEYESFTTFHEKVKALVAPEGLAESMETYFRDQVGNALADIQTLIPLTRQMNVRFVQKEDVVEFCGASSFDGPLGKISQVFAYKPGSDCRKYYYKYVMPEAMDCWQARQRCVLCDFDDSTNIYDSPYCNYVIDGEEACGSPYLTPPEDDCKFKSLDDDDRIFTVGPDRKVFVAPRFPCGYVLVVQSQDILRKWVDSDQVAVDQQLREAVVNYVEHKMATKERERQAAGDYFDAYTMNLRMLKFRYHDEYEQEQKRDCSAALEQRMSAFRPLYETSVYGPFGGSFTDPTTGDDVQEVYWGASPPAAPEDPTRPAIFYYSGSYQIAVWDVTAQAWV